MTCGAGEPPQGVTEVLVPHEMLDEVHSAATRHLTPFVSHQLPQGSKPMQAQYAVDRKSMPSTAGNGWWVCTGHCRALR